MTGENGQRLERHLTGAAWTVASLLASGDPGVVAAFCVQGVTAADLEDAVRTLDGPLIDPPPVDHLRLKLTELPQGGYRVKVPLWTSAETPSMALDAHVSWTSYDTVDCVIVGLTPIGGSEALGSRQDPIARPSAPPRRDAPSGDSMAGELDAGELDAIAELVQALVERDFDLLHRLVDDPVRPADLEDLYRWTKRWRYWDEVTLIMPPGRPESWSISFDGSYAEPYGRHVLVAMWTEQEGFSDLTLEAGMYKGPNGDVQVRFRELHVM